MEQRYTDHEPQDSSWQVKCARYAVVYLRVSLGAGFLSAVADRFGIWGPPGARLVAWGNFHNFLRYTAILNPWFPHSWIPVVGWLATICEASLGVALLLGFRTRAVAFCSGLLTLAFALGMICGVGVKAPLNYSVFVISAAAFVLANQKVDLWSADSWALRRRITSHPCPDVGKAAPRAT